MGPSFFASVEGPRNRPNRRIESRVITQASMADLESIVYDSLIWALKVASRKIYIAESAAHEA